MIDDDGVQLHCVGGDEGLSVVLLLGTMDSLAGFKTGGLIDELAKTHCAIPFYRPGCAHSTPNIEVDAAQLSRLLLKRVITIAHAVSEHGSPAQLSALRRGEIDLGLVRTSPAVPGLRMERLTVEPMCAAAGTGR
jgi:hypothetical protein